MDHNPLQSSIVTRFAPSPTGFLHIGGVRTALFAFLFAKQHNGAFILRIEDTDKEREVSGSIEHIIESLSWLGITWEYGPYTHGPFGSCIQSERLDRYKHYAHILIEKGLAYPDPYTPKEVAEFKAQAAARHQLFLFRNHRPTTFGTWDGTKPLRLKVPNIKRYTWIDATRGKLSAGEEMLDDFVLIKSDGYPTYNFAHIIDDFEMGVTHIMRADEFIASTPKFLSLYDALAITPPVFVTMPPILRDDRTKKLGKRDGAKDILEYRSDGYLPEAMANFLALTGWNPGTEQELFTMAELALTFHLGGIQRGGAAFNEEKLLWMNKQYLDRLSDEEYLLYLQADVPTQISTLPQFNEERLLKLLPVIRERIHTRREFHEAAAGGEYDFAFSTPQYDTAILQWKKDPSSNEALPRLEKAITLLEETDFSSPETIKTALIVYAEEVGRGELLWPLRVALSGRERSPDPFTIAYIIGKEETIARIKAACDKIGE